MKQQEKSVLYTGFQMEHAPQILVQMFLLITASGILPMLLKTLIRQLSITTVPRLLRIPVPPDLSLLWILHGLEKVLFPGQAVRKSMRYVFQIRIGQPTGWLLNITTKAI